MIVARTDPAAMDRVIVQPPRWRRRALIAAIVIAVAGGAAFALHREGGRALAVEGSRVTFGRVSRGQFDDVIQIRGQVKRVSEQGASEHIDSLAKKYLGKDKYPFGQPGEVRVMYEIEPRAANAMG